MKRPSYQLLGWISLRQGLMGFHMVYAIDNGGAGFEQLDLLSRLFSQGGKVFLVGGTNIGQQAQGGLNHGLQRFHLTGLRNTSLKQPQFGSRIQLPNRQRYTYL